MPSWDSVLREIAAEEESRQLRIGAAESCSPVDIVRGKYITALAEKRGRNVICYYSGWLQNGQDIPMLSIQDDDMNGFMNAVHGMDRSKGLDLLLHTPGGDLAATEAIVKYLKACFGNDICAIVPQLAMSAGTMIACACKSIVMGKQSSLGPTDPQFGGVAAGGVIEEFEEAVRSIKENPDSAPLWQQIVGKYHPTFLGDCQKALEASKVIVRSWLMDNMLSSMGQLDAFDAASDIVDKLCDHKSSAMHNRHFSCSDLEAMGFHIDHLEDDHDMQDLVLTIHHAFMNTFALSQAVKIIESGSGKRWVQSAA